MKVVDANLRKLVYIHAGSHKTGTTSIQAMLAANERVLAEAGIFIPKTGRTSPQIAGHHNIAFELSKNKHFDDAKGTFAELLNEIARAGMPTVCLSSEEFGCLGTAPGALAKLYGGLQSIGYDPRLIFYLRPQVDYLESLYAEIVKSWTVSFAQVYTTMLTTGVFGNSFFDYDRLIDQYDNVFGAKRLQVRAYHSTASPNVLLQDFFGLLCSDRHTIDFETLSTPERLNQMLTYAEVFAARARVLAELGVRSEGGVMEIQRDSSNFDPLTLVEILCIWLRFWPSNDRLGRKHAVHLRGASWRIIVREIITSFFGDADAQLRKARFRQLDRSAEMRSRTSDVSHFSAGD